jgi:hypothetical protein
MPTPLFLSLLVLLTPLDDVWARGTPDRDDHAMAAANNDFLSRTADEGTALPPRTAACAAWLAPPAEATRPTATCGWPPFGPDRLYLLMSLQR